MHADYKHMTEFLNELGIAKSRTPANRTWPIS